MYGFINDPAKRALKLDLLLFGRGYLAFFALLNPIQIVLLAQPDHLYVLEHTVVALMFVAYYMEREEIYEVIFTIFTM